MSHHQKAIIYDALSDQDLDLRPPRQNRDRRSMSAASSNRTRIQLGTGEYTVDDMGCVLEEIFDEQESQEYQEQVLESLKK